MTEKILKWSNLKINKCPNCGKDFVTGLTTVPKNGQQLLIHKCGFKIYERRYSQIVNSQVTADLERKLIEEQEDLL